VTTAGRRQPPGEGPGAGRRERLGGAPAGGKRADSPLSGAMAHGERDGGVARKNSLSPLLSIL